VWMESAQKSNLSTRTHMLARKSSATSSKVKTNFSNSSHTNSLSILIPNERKFYFCRKKNKIKIKIFYFSLYEKIKPVKIHYRIQPSYKSREAIKLELKQFQAQLFHKLKSPQ
jgi:hypothetical protein